MVVPRTVPPSQVLGIDEFREMSWMRKDVWSRRVMRLLRTCLGPVSHFHNDCTPPAYAAASQYLVCDVPTAAVSPKAPRAHAGESMVQAKV